MNVLSYFIGGSRVDESPPDLRDFVSPSSMRDLLGKGDAADSFSDADMLLIFETKTQHTWLIATHAALYCVIDNRRQSYPRLLWRIPRDEVIKDGQIILQINEAMLTDRDNYLIIGRMRPRKFTKALFRSLPVKDSIENMLRHAFAL